jgi:hypothetical protein
MQYAIKDTYTFSTTQSKKVLPLVARTSAPAEFLFQDWADFYLFPPSADGNILTSVSGATVVGECGHLSMASRAQSRCCSDSASAALEALPISPRAAIVDCFIWD